MYRLFWFLLIAAEASAQPTLVHAGRILDVAAGSYRQNQGILIDAGIIRQVGAYDAIRAAAPQNAVLIDLSGTTVLPALIDCHAHLMLSIPDHLNGADGLILTAAKYTPAKRVLMGAQLAKEVLESGFTIVRNVGHSGIDGDVALRAMRSTTDGYRARGFWLPLERSRRVAGRRCRSKIACSIRSCKKIS
ncbi:MAG TPA: amidohydrolase family protein [Bryobacteraceae bacterium]|nr:amidohydrolase family protein [Bryobacteraceae bacterium]